MEHSANGTDAVRASVVPAARAARINALHEQTIRRAAVAESRLDNQAPGSAFSAPAAAATTTSNSSGIFF